MTIVSGHMQTIPAGRAKARFLALIDSVERTRTEVVISKRGRPVVRIAPLEIKRKSLKSRARITGDVLSPVDGPWAVP